MWKTQHGQKLGPVTAAHLGGPEKRAVKRSVCVCVCDTLQLEN